MKLEVKLSIQGLETRIMGTWGPGDVPSPFQSQYYPCWVFKTTPGVGAQYANNLFFFFSILTLGNVLTIFLALYHKDICILGCGVICKAIVTMWPETMENGCTSHPKWQVKDSSRHGQSHPLPSSLSMLKCQDAVWPTTQSFLSPSYAWQAHRESCLLIFSIFHKIHICLIAAFLPPWPNFSSLPPPPPVLFMRPLEGISVYQNIDCSV